jgi:hypothetical protein
MFNPPLSDLIRCHPRAGFDHCFGCSLQNKKSPFSFDDEKGPLTAAIA